MDLLMPEVTFIPDPAERIDLENRRIFTFGGDVFDYDKVVLATGAVASPQLIPGLAEGSVNFHTGPVNALKVWERVRNFKVGRIGVLIAGVPHRCPPTPDEALFLLDECFRRKGTRIDVELTLLTPYSTSYPADQIARVVSNLFEEKGIKILPFFNVESVDPSTRKVHSSKGDEYDYDLLIAVPPHRGARVVRESGLGDDYGWIRADKCTMTVDGHDDAFGIGDATNIPTYKSGVVAYLESRVVAANIAAAVEGEEREFEYDGRINCSMEVGNRRAIFVSATYQKPPSAQSPSLLKYAMKRGFDALYWSAVSGRREWMMNRMLGPTSETVKKVVSQNALQV